MSVPGARRWWARAIGVCVLVPATAGASNGTHPRTPVLWNDVPCVTVHDRSQGATLHLPYAIPFEDTEPTADEVADSRRHQFVAFCRSHSPQEFLPSWITGADVQSAADKLLLTVDVVPPDDILEQAMSWTDCWYRINADDDRRPIDMAHAEAGVDWDTTGLPIGGYDVQGYTYEPVFNQWWPRPGAVKLHDGDPDAAGPVGAIATGELTPYRNEAKTIVGFVDAIAGTTYDVEWARVVPPDEPTVWERYASALPLDARRFSFELTPPEALWGESGLLRVVFNDPTGRSFTAYQLFPMLVIDADDPSSCAEGGGFIGTPCDESSSGGDGGGEPPIEHEQCNGIVPAQDGEGESSGGGEGGSTTTGGPGSSGPSQTGGESGGTSDGCGCTSDAQPPGWALLFVLGGLGCARRRRASP